MWTNFMADGTLGWGVIGTGTIATKFSEDLGLVDGARAVAVHSRSGEKGEIFAERHGFRRTHDDLHAFLGDPKIEAVYIASPNTSHLPQALAAIDAGKAILIEKPVAMTAADTREIAGAAAARGVFVMEAMWTRFLPAVQRAKGLLDSGAIGTPVKAEAVIGFARDYDPNHRLYNKALGGGVLHDLGVYPISLAQMMLGEADLVSAEWHAAESGVDEEAALELSCRAVPVRIRATFRADADNTFLIHGTEGALQLDRHFLRGPSVSLWNRPLRRSPPGAASLAGRLLKRFPIDGRERKVLEYPGHGLHFEARAAQAAILAGKAGSDVMPMEDSANALAIIEKALAEPPRS
jgi:predicted dehydrogenase